MKKLSLIIFATILLATCYGQNNDKTSLGSFQATLKYMEHLLNLRISKEKFGELLPIRSRFLKSESLGHYNPSTDKHDIYTHRYYYSSEYRNTPIEINIEEEEFKSMLGLGYMVITKIEVVIIGVYWGGQIKEGDIAADIYAQAAEGNYKSKGAIPWGNGMKEIMRNDNVTVELFRNIVNPRVVYGMSKNAH